MKKVELTLRDAFGSPYNVVAFPRSEIIKKLDNLDISEVVEMGYGAQCQGLADGVVYMDITTGELTTGTYTTGSGDIQGTHLVSLYTVEQNLDLSADDILTDEEMIEMNERGLSMSEYIEEEDIDLDERTVTALEYYAYDHLRSEEWGEKINEQLDRIYEDE